MPEPIVPAPMTAMRRSSRGVRTLQRGVLGAVSFGEELVAQRERLARHAQALEDGAFVGQSVVDGDRGCCHDGVDGGLHLGPALAGLERGGRGLRDRAGLRCGHGSVAQTLLAATQLSRMGHRRGAKLTLRFGIDQARGKSRSAADTLAAADHADGARDAHDARQPLRAAGARDDAQRHFRQAHQRARRRDTGITAQRQLEAAAQRRAMQRRHDRLAAVFDGLDHGGQLRFGQGLAELAQVGARDEGAAGADEHGTLQAVIGLDGRDGGHQAFTHGRRTGIDGRVVDDDDGDVAVALEAHVPLFHLSPLRPARPRRRQHARPALAAARRPG